jgi:hypothetical protein
VAVKGKRIFTHGFLPAASPKALTRIGREIRSWALHHRSDKSLKELAAMYNPTIRGWIAYYSHFYRTRLRPTLRRIDAYVIRWARRKYKRMLHQTRGAREWFDRLRRATPRLFAHWRLHCVRRELNAGTNRCELRGLFVDLDAEAKSQQACCYREPANTSADDRNASSLCRRCFLLRCACLMRAENSRPKLFTLHTSSSARLPLAFSSARLEDLFHPLTILKRAWLLQRVKGSEQYQ